MNPCTICTSDARAEIEAAMSAGQSYRAIARQYAQYGISKDGVARHKAHREEPEPRQEEHEEDEPEPELTEPVTVYPVPTARELQPWPNESYQHYGERMALAFGLTDAEVTILWSAPGRASHFITTRYTLPAERAAYTQRLRETWATWAV
jgi:hypothetical protein